MTHREEEGIRSKAIMAVTNPVSVQGASVMADKGVAARSLSPSSFARQDEKRRRQSAAYNLFFQHERQLALNNSSSIMEDRTMETGMSTSRFVGYSYHSIGGGGNLSRKLAIAISAKWSSLSSAERALYETLANRGKASGRDSPRGGSSRPSKSKMAKKDSVRKNKQQQQQEPNKMPQQPLHHHPQEQQQQAISSSTMTAVQQQQEAQASPPFIRPSFEWSNSFEQKKEPATSGMEELSSSSSCSPSSTAGTTAEARRTSGGTPPALHVLKLPLSEFQSLLRHQQQQEKVASSGAPVIEKSSPVATPSLTSDSSLFDFFFGVQPECQGRYSSTTNTPPVTTTRKRLDDEVLSPAGSSCSSSAWQELFVPELLHSSSHNSKNSRVCLEHPNKNRRKAASPQVENFSPLNIISSSSNKSSNNNILSPSSRIVDQAFLQDLSEVLGPECQELFVDMFLEDAPGCTSEDTGGCRQQ